VLHTGQVLPEGQSEVSMAKEGIQT
jgi:hypothetical protein